MASLMLHALALANVPSVPVTVEDVPSFAAFATTFAKSYETDVEQLRRAKIYEKNLKVIFAHNSGPYTRGEAGCTRISGFRTSLQRPEFCRCATKDQHARVSLV